MFHPSFAKASKPNPKLKPLSFLIGEWKTKGSHPFLPGVTLEGQASFKWLEGGAFLIMHTVINHKDFPAGVYIFGTDDSLDTFSIQYFDERGVSRQYTAVLKDNFLRWFRHDAKFAQRCDIEITSNGDTLIAKGEMSQKGGPWEKDLELTYTRIKFHFPKNGI